MRPVGYCRPSGRVLGNLVTHCASLPGHFTALKKFQKRNYVRVRNPAGVVGVPALAKITKQLCACPFRLEDGWAKKAGSGRVVDRKERAVRSRCSLRLWGLLLCTLTMEASLSKTKTFQLPYGSLVHNENEIKCLCFYKLSWSEPVFKIFLSCSPDRKGFHLSLDFVP